MGYFEEYLLENIYDDTIRTITADETRPPIHN